MSRIHVQPLDDAAEEQAALHALGLVPPSGRAAYEEHLLRCGPCRAAVRDLEPAAASLGWLATETDPPKTLKVALLARLTAPGPSSTQPWKSWPAEVSAGGFHFVPGDGSGFEPTGIAGIETRRLHVDPSADRVTMLVCMAAGTAYPRHRHGGDEECYVISGDLRVGDRLHMKAGDYQLARAGSAHETQSTDHGCLLLLVSSLHDEMLA